MIESKKTTVGNSLLEVTTLKAAAYARMSTEGQSHSIDNQLAAISGYADANGYDIIKVYLDSGRSGLDLRGRSGLKRLLQDVTSGETEYSVVLVYDVSRWGRFQNCDEGAYYEFACRRAGIKVIYVTENFPREPTPLMSFLKGLRRASAADYSRQLGEKVLAAQLRIAKGGFLASGSPPYGLRRAAVDEKGAYYRSLSPGERKPRLRDRVVLVLGPPEQVQTVRDIFRMFVAEDKTVIGIVNHLKLKGLEFRPGLPFNAYHVRAILRAKKYVGTNVFNQTTQRLKAKVKRNDPSKWVEVPAAFAGIIDGDTFTRAQEKFPPPRPFARDRQDTSTWARKDKLPTSYSKEYLLQTLVQLLESKGTLSRDLVKSGPDLPPLWVYHKYFGDLENAFGMVGFIGGTEKQKAMPLFTAVSLMIREAAAAASVVASIDYVKKLATIGYTLTILVTIDRGLASSRLIRPAISIEPPKIYLIARADGERNIIVDYFLITVEPGELDKTISLKNTYRNFEPYNFDNVQPLELAISEMLARSLG